MNNIKKTVLGMLIAVLAFGISAYTTVKNGAIVRYYKTDMTYPAANNPSGYYYFSDNRCEVGGNLCSAKWNIGTNPLPADGDPLPLIGVSFQSSTSGHFE
ncbi:MAG TPA: hypothetical protein VK541_06815 [Pedobacter sp.]|uniref:hypothetical protein n=1 Tax=Pedobacter sp. TaxID=1411316 RepID=UPI002C287CAB|nr:hypothetical protein [Pedobacter sp.]HMI02174.1 hypothetical protein [Pedobacter sp.]